MTGNAAEHNLSAPDTAAVTMKRHPLLSVPLLILTAGVILRVLYLLDFARIPLLDQVTGPDVQEYYRQARLILHGNMWFDAQSIHGPLYPAFLAGLLKLCADDLFFVRLAQSVLVLAAGLGFYGVLKDDFRTFNGFRRHIPEVFLGIYATYPPFIGYQCELFSENLMLILLSTGIYTFHRGLQSYYDADTVRRNTLTLFGASGMLCALAAAAHPICLLLIPFLGLHLAVELRLFPSIRRKKNSAPAETTPYKFRFAAAAVFFAGAMLFTAGISIGASRLAGREVFMQSNSGFNFYLGNHAGADGTCGVPPGAEWQKLHADARTEGMQRGISPDRVFLERAGNFLIREPGRAAMLFGRKALLTVGWKELTTWSDAVVLGLTFLHRNLWNLFVLIALPGLASLIAGIFVRTYRDDFRLFLILFAAIFCANVLLVTSGRYRIGLTVALMVFAADYLCTLPELFTAKNRRALKGYLGALLPAGLLIFLSVPPDTAARERACALDLLGSAWLKSGNDRMAGQCWQESLAASSEGERVPNQLARLREKQGDIVGAEQAYRQIIRDYPESPFAYMNLGALCADSGRTSEALQWYAEAAKYRIKGTMSAELAYNRGLLFHRAGKAEAAEAEYRNALAEDPLLVSALNNLGLLRLSQNDAAEAELLLRRALALEPDQPMRKMNLALALRKNGHVSEAERREAEALPLLNAKKPASSTEK